MVGLCGDLVFWLFVPDYMQLRAPTQLYKMKKKKKNHHRSLGRCMRQTKKINHFDMSEWADEVGWSRLATYAGAWLCNDVSKRTGT